jgi:hypothetical protein
MRLSCFVIVITSFLSLQPCLWAVFFITLVCNAWSALTGIWKQWMASSSWHTGHNSSSSSSTTTTAHLVKALSSAARAASSHPPGSGLVINGPGSTSGLHVISGEHHQQQQHIPVTSGHTALVTGELNRAQL